MIQRPLKARMLSRKVTIPAAYLVLALIGGACHWIPWAMAYQHMQAAIALSVGAETSTDIVALMKNSEKEGVEVRA